MKLSSLKISHKLALGFGAVGLLLPVAVVFGIMQSKMIEKDVGDIAKVKAPITLASGEISADVYKSVSLLRAYVLNPTVENKTAHDVAWKSLDHELMAFDELATALPAEIQAEWQGVKNTFREFRQAQNDIANLAGTPDAYPAIQLMDKEALPRAKKLFSAITAMIDNEQGQIATPDRKNLLKIMADVRGNLANSIGNMKLYLVSGNASAKEDFLKRWNTMPERVVGLGGQSGLFSSQQTSAFAEFKQIFSEFEAIPAQLFKIRESESWNLAVYRLRKDVVPLQNTILDFIDGAVGEDGSRSGGLKEVQSAELVAEAHHAYSSLETMIYLLVGLLVAGVAIGAVLSVIISRSITNPLARIGGQLVDVSDGSFDIEIDGTGRGDEIGDMARCLEVLRDKSEAAYKSARENTRIRSALDSCLTNVMVADDNYNVVYLNQSLGDMLGEAEAELRTELPKFDSKKLLGENIDVFHKNPSHQRNLLDSLRAPYKTTLNIGNLIFDLVTTPVFDDAGSRIGTVVEWTDRTKEEAQEREMKKALADNTRIKVALDNCSTNVMVADNDYNIVYMNDSVTDMMKTAESDLRQELPQFDSNKLVGSNIDVFHKNPAHQRSMLERLSSTYNTSISVAGRTFDLIANPVMDADGQRLGSVVEWRDVTQERSVESEIDTMVNAAVNGDFAKRIGLEGKTGFMRNLAEAMNRLCDTTGAALDDVNRNLESIAEGDLTKRITNSYSGRFDDLKNRLNQTAEQLSEIVLEVTVSANEVTNASSEITSGTNDLSQRTEQQASNLQETAASMEEIASTIKQNADNAQQANQLAISARTVASDGGDVVGKAVTAMSQIEDSSQKISDITGVIDEIAFQTNLLALNAAVEAARAGDAGKGFAVVASEVRSLAQRSSEAAKDIKALIVESGSQVKDGVTLVNNAGTSLTDIVDSVKRVTDIVSEIAAASREQATGVEEINKAISQMDEMTQQNSALVEENAAACRMLQEQAGSMHNRMSFFRAGNAGEGAGKHVPRSMPASRPVVAEPAQVVRAAGGGGSVATMQADIQTAFHEDDDWKEF